MAERVIDARADVYALGAVTYEMLTGEAPCTGPTMQAIVTRAMTERPRALSATVRRNPSLDVRARRALFPVVDTVGTNPHASYDVSPDGKMFVMVRRTPASRIMVVQNLLELMTR